MVTIVRRENALPCRGGDALLSEVQSVINCELCWAATVYEAVWQKAGKRDGRSGQFVFLLHRGTRILTTGEGAVSSFPTQAFLLPLDTDNDP